LLRSVRIDLLAPASAYFSSPGGITMTVASLAERQGTEQRLQELQNELLHVSRLSAMGQMNAAIAHELNQPLTAVMNYVKAAQHLISQDEMTQAQKQSAIDAMNKAAEQTMRAGSIIRNLRNFIEKRESKRTPENINNVVEEAIALGLAGAADSNVKVKLDLEPGLPFVLIDRIQIQQVLINLIRNGIEAMTSARTRELALMTAAIEPGFAHIMVRDTGPGIDASVMARLFQPFVTMKEKGMGIGLTISQSIVETHGGRIWVEEAKPMGTAFNIRLPQGEEDMLFRN